MIRPGSPGDVGELRALRAAYAAELDERGASLRHGGDEWERWISRRLAAGDVRVGLAGARIAAYIVWEVRGAAGEARRLSIDELYVAAAQRGHQLGSGLLARALDRARVLGLDEAVLDAGAGGDGSGLPAQFGFEPRGDGHVRSLRVG